MKQLDETVVMHQICRVLNIKDWDLEFDAGANNIP